MTTDTTTDCPYCLNSNFILKTDAPGTRCSTHAQRERQMSDIFRRIMPETYEPRYRYFEHRNWMYCWTTERYHGKFSAFIYQPNKAGTTWTLIKEVSFTKRVTAKNKAYGWYQKAKSRPSGRLPAAMLK